MRTITIFTQLMNTTLRSLTLLLRERKGQSLAEFAVITAMMATFVTTSIPKFSEIMEIGKETKSIQELDKLLVQAKNFYDETATLEGRGRLPGQDKYDLQVGQYTDTLDVFNDLKLFTTFENENIGKKWVSVFGTDHSDASMSSASFFEDDTVTADGFGYSPGGKKYCENCAEGRETGADAWLRLFTREVIISPYQDGHYIYVVVPGSGTGEDVISPKIFVADAENPKDLHKYIAL